MTREKRHKMLEKQPVGKEKVFRERRGKSVSLHPLTFEDAVRGLLAVEPEEPEGKRRGKEKKR